MVLHKEYRKPQCIKKVGIVLSIKRPFEATQSYLIDTQKYNENCYLITAWFANETNK